MGLVVDSGVAVRLFDVLALLVDDRDLGLDGEAARFHVNPADVFAVDVDDLGCLLYTSPSPRDRTRSRMPSSA